MPMRRNYDDEMDESDNAAHEKYAYKFDFDVLQPFMIRSFKPFFRKGAVLELGATQEISPGAFSTISMM